MRLPHEIWTNLIKRKIHAGQALFLADDYKVVTKFEPTDEEKEMFGTTPTAE